VNAVCIAGSAVLVYLIIREVAAESLALPAYLLTVAFMGVGSTYSASGSYLCSPTFQPSTVAVLGYLLSMLWFLRQRYLASGLCLAAAGAFHANFAVLAVPLFALAHIFLGGSGWLRRSILQLAPVCVTLALLSPLLLSQSGSPHVEQARFIFQNVLSPQHYQPATFWTEFVVYYAWCALGALAGWDVFSNTAAGRRLRGLWWSSLLLVSVATLLTTAVFLSTVSQLYFWRLAPFTVLISQIVGSAGFVAHLASEDPRLSAARRSLVFLLAALLIWLTFRYHYGEYRFLQYGILIALAVVFLLHPLFLKLSRLRKRAFTTLVVWEVWAVAALVPAASLASHSSLLDGLPREEAVLCAWAATTPESSVFLIPPQFENFRLNARRAVVVDFKSTPVNPGQLLEWYRRLCLVCGRDDVKGFADAVTGYAELDPSRLADIEAKHRVDYIVVTDGQPFAGAQGWLPVFGTEAVRVYGRADAVANP
jgi:hypothetical protein